MMGSADVWWSHVPVVGRAVRFAVLLIVLRLADFMTAVTCAATADDDRHQQHLQQQQHVHLTELSRNIIKGLKLEKLPDMTKVDISNEEFHCKYLEYFRRLYVDESEFYDPDDNDDVTIAASYDNDDDHDVSAILIRGQVKHFGGDNRNDESPDLPTDDDGDVLQQTTSITFPIYDTAVRGSGSRVTVIKSVARIYADAPHARVRVYGRLLQQAGAVLRENPSLVADLIWPVGGSGRWVDVDVTRLLRPRKRHRGGGVTAASLELLLRYSATAAAGSVRFGDETDNDGRYVPVLHAFMNGAVDGGARSATAAVRCPGETKRKKREGGGGRGRDKKHRRPTASGRVRRTDCKVDTSSGNDNGTEHGGGGGGNKCCREEMRVVFADIPGFDFIVEPKWFDAGLCRGRCPAKYNPATRHAFIQSLLWKQHNNNRRTEVAGDGGERRARRKVRHGGGGAATATTKAPQPPPKPCCAPNKLDRLQIIHVDETDPSSLKVTTWKEMAVVECACS
ncbi:uncharacterized protein LOC132927596 [Rhopalosiphum padi]|uniref:uncharacterized protein LOC132927596 n=1 Tax=Rhopalosiphum padi TaxID=40932 RepID=UPI00298EAFE5|nr:uncharacterized protein LOC132927596 [Rhopalosiphum padi]